MEKGEVGWRRGDSGAMTKAGSEGRRRVRASRGANLPVWQQGVMASRSFILGLLPGLKSMVWLIRSIRLRVPTGPQAGGGRMPREDWPFPAVSKKG